jgi:mono/diheme cytochrome c family protein
MKLFVGMIIGLLLPFAAFGIVLALGAYDMSATRAPGTLESIVGGALADRSIERRAPKTRNPLGQTPEVLRAGFDQYREMCVQCHGAPGVPSGELGKGLNPPPPNLATRETQGASDGELFHVIAHGVRMTGMPGWLPTHSQREIWQLVAFVRHLPALSAEETRALREASAAEQTHHHEPARGGARGRQGEAQHPAGLGGS